MSWDEKDWSHTWITGIPERFGNSPKRGNKDEIINGKRVYTLFQYDRDVCDLSYGNQCKLEQIAKEFGVKIKFQYLSNPSYCFDYSDSNPTISKEELINRDLIKEVLSIV